MPSALSHESDLFWRDSRVELVNRDIVLYLMEYFIPQVGLVFMSYEGNKKRS
jgi:hypothetical protein